MCDEQCLINCTNMIHSEELGTCCYRMGDQRPVYLSKDPNDEGRFLRDLDCIRECEAEDAAYQNAEDHCSVLIGDSWGVYVPQRFAESYGEDYLRAIQAEGKKLEDAQEDINILLEGPDAEYYWEVWDDILDFGMIDVGQITGEHKRYYFYQDGDLFCWDDEDAMHTHFENLSKREY